MEWFKNIVEQNQEMMSEEDYRKIKAISGTNYRTFCMQGSKAFYMQYNGELIVEESKQMMIGTAIHSAYLEPDKFENDYVVFKGVRPNSAQKVEFANFLAGGHLATEAYKLCYKTEKLSEKALDEKSSTLAMELLPYVNFLEKSIGKKSLTEEEYKLVQSCIIALSSNKFVKQLKDNFKDSNHYYELPILSSFEDLSLKGKIDWGIVDKNTNTGYVIDLKTSYDGSYNNKGYNYQVNFYCNLLKDKFNLSEVHGYILGVTTNEVNSARMFKVNVDYPDLLLNLSLIKKRFDSSLWGDDDYTEDPPFIR